jgi:hypothetical protein
MPDKPPRRKVVRAHQTVIRWSGLFECRLECGHTVTAAGRAASPGLRKEPPKTAGCYQCAALAQAGHTGDVK